jgi:hypothetical protein
MVPEPSRTSTNEHQRTALTCNVLQNRRSAHDRNNLDTVEVTDPRGHPTAMKLCRSAASTQMSGISRQSLSEPPPPADHYPSVGCGLAGDWRARTTTDDAQRPTTAGGDLTCCASQPQGYRAARGQHELSTALGTDRK